MSDLVNSPSHYNHGMEVIELIEGWRLGFCLGSAAKYVLRHKYKGTPKLDLEKTKWYLLRHEQNTTDFVGNIVNHTCPIILLGDLRINLDSVEGKFVVLLYHLIKASHVSRNHILCYMIYVINAEIIRLENAP